MQGDAPYRMTPQDLDRWYVRTTTGTMAPFSSFATSSWTIGPATLTRYNGLPAIEIQGQGRRRASASGTALAEMDKLFQKLPKDVGYRAHRPVLSGRSQRRAGPGALCAVHPGDLSLPGGAL